MVAPLVVPSVYDEGVKVSISLTTEDLAFLDEYARSRGLGSRSAAVRAAVVQLRASGLGDDYEAAWSAWDTDGEAAEWEPVVGDGITG